MTEETLKTAGTCSIFILSGSWNEKRRIKPFLYNFNHFCYFFISILTKLKQVDLHLCSSSLVNLKQEKSCRLTRIFDLRAFWLYVAKTYLRHCQTSTMKFFVEIAVGKPLTIIAKSFIIRRVTRKFLEQGSFLEIRALW